MLAASEVLGPSGPLSRHLDNFQSRAEQQELADAIAVALKGRQHLICEAATGTGKTFAYLIPAMLSGRKVVISTGTKALQDQLIENDFPVLKRALGWTGSVAVLKGRANYLCHHRLALTEARGLASRADAHQLVEVRRWAGATRVGDTAEVASIEESSTIWRQVTSTVDNCLGTQCEFYDDCFVLKARRRALDADLVIINHHLLFADLSLREQGFGELLPRSEAVIVDEAHQIPEIASQFFGSALGTRQLERLAEDALQAYRTDAGDLPEVDERLRKLLHASAAPRAFLPRGEGRLSWAKTATNRQFRETVDVLSKALREAMDGLALLSARSVELGNVHRRAQALNARLDAILSPADEGTIVWLECRPRSFTWHVSPIEVKRLFREQLDGQSAGWVFLSATLRVRGEFGFFTERLGLDEVATHAWDSPFDYQEQTICYIPSGLPEPRDERYTRALLDAVLPVIQRTKGRAFLLFTSYRALHEARKFLETSRADEPFTVLAQGDQPRAELIRVFKTADRAVLLGTSSFWQGVDVRGDALSCVVIDKLPFESPGDPVLQARVAHLQEQGRQASTLR